MSQNPKQTQLLLDELDYFKIPGPGAYISLKLQKSTPSYKFGCEQKFQAVQKFQTPSPSQYLIENGNSQNCQAIRFSKDKKYNDSDSRFPGVGAYNLQITFNKSKGFSFGKKFHKRISKPQKTGNPSIVIVYYTYLNTYQIGKWFEDDQDDGNNFEKVVLYKKEYLIKDYIQKKVGQWVESRNNEQCEVMFKGEYDNGYRIGKWKYYWKKNLNDPYELIYGGSYDGEENSKNGQWIELSDNFSKNSIVTYNGLYKNNNKLGRWEICYFGENIGGGLYDEEQYQKNGKWIELSDGFNEKYQVAFQGEYQNDKKIGNWDIYYFGEQIGGGLYNVEQNKKNGIWVELFEGFKEESQVTMIGEYKNDHKVGRWDTYYFGEQIGGGLYDAEQNIKTGRWIELCEGFNEQCQITMIGDYKNNHKVGRWDIYYFGEQIGGGQYDEEEYFKIGKWIEFDNSNKDIKQLTIIGEYKNGKKVGNWDVYYFGELIGGGSYDEEQHYKKGKWVELCDEFKDLKQVTYTGEYKNAKKSGKWDIRFRNPCENKQFEQIGGGEYDELMKKNGQWTELNDGFQYQSQIIYQGNYRSDIKTGRWEICYRPYYNKEVRTIGGGEYIENQKTGRWIELSDRFYDKSQVTYNGEYKNGNKIGSWDIQWRERDDSYIEKIGGGQYDERVLNQKNGNWVELSNGFYDMSQITYKGEYKKGKKIGRWEAFYSKNNQIGGGSYDDKPNCNGAGEPIKIGRWIELSDQFTINSKVTYEGEYQNGKKVGRWDTFLKHNGENRQMQDKNIYKTLFIPKMMAKKISGGGSYDYNQKGDGVIGSIKIGRWIEISQQFYYYSQITYNGEYKNGKKVGKWDTFFNYKEESQQMQVEYQYILFNHQIFGSGGGQYDDKQHPNGIVGSIKIGKWIELCDNFGKALVEQEIIYNGEYSKGKKVGVWDEIDLNENKKIKETNYDH